MTGLIIYFLFLREFPQHIIENNQPYAEWVYLFPKSDKPFDSKTYRLKVIAAELPYYPFPIPMEKAHAEMDIEITS